MRHHDGHLRERIGPLRVAVSWSVPRPEGTSG